MKFIYALVLFLPALATALPFHKDEIFISEIKTHECLSKGETCEDASLVNRIIAAYQFAKKSHLGDSMWQMFYDQKLEGIHTVFQSGNLTQATKILRNPSQTDLFWGIDNLCQSLLKAYLTKNGIKGLVRGSQDCLLRCAESMGAIKLDNPERTGPPIKRWTNNEILQTIEGFLGISIYFPNPYADEIGVCTYQGIASYRAIQALYQAYRIKELVKDIPNPRILEIGAGLGRTAYYCNLLGITDYTIIDIPMTALASSYFLGRTLGENQIVLLGENLADSENKVKILTPDQFLCGTGQYDLIVNVDSLTEMAPENIDAYLKKIQESSPMFLSINHEINRHSVCELLTTSPYLKKVHRYPYWMRLGYVEEVYLFNL